MRSDIPSSSTYILELVPGGRVRFYINLQNPIHDLYNDTSDTQTIDITSYFEESTWNRIYASYDSFQGAYNKIYYDDIFVGSTVVASIPRPTLSTTTYTLGDVMYSGTDTCSSNVTYTANSTAKMGGTTAKNKGSFSFTVNAANLISFPTTYKQGGGLQPESIKTGYFIKY